MSLSILLSTVAMGVIIFAFGGISQTFPWGVPSVQMINASSNQDNAFMTTKESKTFEPNSFTTPTFETQFAEKISTLTTNQSFSWIISTDVKNYNPKRYFVREIATQLGVALILSIMLSMTIGWQLSQRLLLVLLASLAGGLTSHGVQLNWWHVPPSYGVGVIVNNLLAWLIAAAVSAKWIIK